jgi:cell fate regulator YaaT (PSP1 superfamily)
MHVVSHMDVSHMTHVVFEGDRGIDMGRVVRVEAASPMARPMRTPMVVRSATDEEVHEWSECLPQLAEEAVAESAKSAAALGIPITIVDAVFQMDRAKLTIYYESEGRVDFRKLLAEMYNRYRCRIWLDKAK